MAIPFLNAHIILPIRDLKSVATGPKLQSKFSMPIPSVRNQNPVQIQFEFTIEKPAHNAVIMANFSPSGGWQLLPACVLCYRLILEYCSTGAMHDVASCVWYGLPASVRPLTVAADDVPNGLCILHLWLDIINMPYQQILAHIHALPISVHDAIIEHLRTSLPNVLAGEKSPFTDLVIEIGEKRYHVHKLVLASQSPVFNAMLNNDNCSESNGLVKINDPFITVDAFEMLLRFVYRENLPNEFWTNANLEDMENAIHIADKYMIEALKGKLEYRLIIRECNDEERISFLRLADRYRLTFLRFVCISLLSTKVTVFSIQHLPVPLMISQLNARKLALLPRYAVQMRL